MRKLLLAVMFLVPAAANAVAPGAPAPDVSAPQLLQPGEQVALKSLRGNVVYVDFWASWCAPCRASFPWLESMNAKYKDKGLLILGVNKDQEVADAERFLAKYPVSFSLVRDPNDALVNRLGLIGMPTAYLIDRKGVIRTVHKGFRSDDQAELEKAFVALLEQQP